MRKQWKTIAMADSEGKAVELVFFWPTGMPAAVTKVLPLANRFPDKEAAKMRSKFAFPDMPFHYSNLSIAHLKPGRLEDVELIPSYMPIATTGVEIRKDSILISERGIGGAPSGIRLRAMSAINYTETPLNNGGFHFDIEYPLYRKVVIGLDDTDSATKGATVMTAMEIANMLDKALKGVEYIRRSGTFNWPENPHKTTNNVSSALVFAARPESIKDLVDWFVKLARRYTISEDTGVAVMEKVRMPEELLAYSRKVKRELVDISETQNIARHIGARLFPISDPNSRGPIGALSAVGLVDKPLEATIPIRNRGLPIVDRSSLSSRGNLIPAKNFSCNET